MRETIALLLFFASVFIAMSASAWFTRRLELLCDRLGLSPEILSILGALGANIPNYAASIDAFATHQPAIGMDIILGSNIFNVAIILGIASFAPPGGTGIRLQRAAIRPVRAVGLYALSIMLLTILIAGLSSTFFVSRVPQNSLPGPFPLFASSFVVLAVFARLVLHIIRRTHAHESDEEEHTARAEQEQQEQQDGQGKGKMRSTRNASLARLSGEIALALALALGGVVVMVQSGQAWTSDLHIPQALTGLLVLAVATSLPNAVVAFILARTGRAATCIEEVFNSNSINATLGVALPLLFWHDALQADPLLLLLDAPLLVALTLAALLATQSGKVSRASGATLLAIYALWIVVHAILL